MPRSVVRAADADERPPADESDFSARKIGVATVCLAGITFGTTYPLVFSLGLLMLPMTHAFGWTRTQFSFAQTFMVGFSVLSMPICGRIADRIGVRPMVILSALALALLSLAMSMQNGELALAYAGYALIGLLGGAGITYAKVVASLFTKHRGKALALFGAESTLSLATIPLITVLLETYGGWRGVYVGFGLTYLAVIPLLYFWLPEPGARASRPGKISAKSAPPRNRIQAPVMQGLTTGQALRDRNFWLLVSAAVIGLVFYQGLSLHLVSLLIERGFSKTLAATAVSSTLLIGIGGGLLGGVLADHFPTARIAAPFQLVAAVGVVAMMLATPAFGGVALLFAAVGLLGAAVSAQQPMTTYFLTRFFGLRSFNEINAIRTALLAAPMALSAPLVGWIYDTTHSYRIAFQLAAGGAVFGAGLLLFMGRYRYAAAVGSDSPNHGGEARDLEPAPPHPAATSDIPIRGMAPVTLPRE